MKKMRNIAIVSGLLVLLQLVYAGIPFIGLLSTHGWTAAKFNMTEAASIAIIGSADGPTSIFVTSGSWWVYLVFFAVCLVTFIWSTALYLKKKKEHGSLSKVK